MPIIIVVCAAAFLGLFLYKIYIRFRLQDKCVGTTVALFFLPEDPQVCFINGNRGKILNARNNTEYIEKEFNDEKQI